MLRNHLSFLTFALIVLGLTTLCAGVVESATLLLNWRDNSTNELGFTIERLISGNYVQIARVGANTQTYTDSGLNVGSTYCYRVRAFNVAGDSLTSNNACATVTGNSPSASTTQMSSTGQTATASTGLTANPTPVPAGTASRWSNYRLAMKIRSTDSDYIGAMFRYQDPNNYYRFSWSSKDRSRRLEKRVGGVFQVLAQDSAPYTVGQTYSLQIVAQDSSLKVFIDGRPVFSVIDGTISEGTIALYSYANQGSAFDDIVVDSNTGSVLLSANFNDGMHRGWTMIDDGNAAGPSVWSAATGALVQSSDISSTQRGQLGTYALYTRANWKDYSVALKMRSADNDSLGVMFRYQDRNNYYRFSWGQEPAGRQLIKRENGIFKVLAEDTVPYVSGHNYLIELIAQGTTLKVNIDGKPVFSVSDQSLRNGTVALYSSHNQGSIFDDVSVVDLATGAVLLWDDFNRGVLTGWTVVDDVSPSAEASNWSLLRGELVQSSDIGSEAFGRVGTFVLH
ncbi:MAG TPA: family 16 glycoside hydrolase [Candidatus Binatia bacterium]